MPTITVIVTMSSEKDKEYDGDVSSNSDAGTPKKENPLDKLSQCKVCRKWTMRPSHKHTMTELEEVMCKICRQFYPNKMPVKKEYRLPIRNKSNENNN